MSRTTPLPRRRLGHTRAATALAAAGALIMSAGVIGLIASPANADKPNKDNPAQGPKSDNAPANTQSPNPNKPTTAPGKPSGSPHGQTNHKSYVCKYVSIPGVGERLQTGQNPIWVDNHALLGPGGGPTFVGQEFSDKQGRSVVIVANTPKLDPEPGVSSCPAPQPPPVPLGPSWNDPCDPGNLTLVDNDPNFNYVISGSTVTARTLAGAAVPGYSWQVPAETNIAACSSGGGGGGGGLQNLTPAVTFTDPDCDNLDGADWDGTLEAFLAYTVTGDADAGETITVQAAIEPGLTGTYQFAPGAQTQFSHTFDDVTLEDCVLGEETVVPKPDKPEPKPDKEPTVKGVEVVVPPAAAPTAVAAGIGDTAASPLQTIAQMLVAGGMLLLVAGAWIGLGRREFGTHEA